MSRAKPSLHDALGPVFAARGNAQQIERRRQIVVDPAGVRRPPPDERVLERVREHLASNPDASGTAAAVALHIRKQDALNALRWLRKAGEPFPSPQRGVHGEGSQRS
jgi:hypothetical protein